METIAVEDATLIETAITVTALASGFADMVKKSVFHGHPLNRDAALTALTALSAAATDALQFVWLAEAARCEGLTADSTTVRQPAAADA